MLPNQDKPLHKKIEEAMAKLPVEQDPIEFLESAFKKFLAEMFITAMDEGMVEKNRLSYEHYKASGRFLINEFMRATDIPDNCKFSVRKYERLLNDAMKGIHNEAKDNQGRDTARVRTVLDMDVKGHARHMQQTQGGIILPPGVKV